MLVTRTVSSTSLALTSGYAFGDKQSKPIGRLRHKIGNATASVLSLSILIRIRLLIIRSIMYSKDENCKYSYVVR